MPLDSRFPIILLCILPRGKDNDSWGERFPFLDTGNYITIAYPLRKLERVTCDDTLSQPVVVEKTCPHARGIFINGTIKVGKAGKLGNERSHALDKKLGHISIFPTDACFQPRKNVAR